MSSIRTRLIPHLPIIAISLIGLSLRLYDLGGPSLWYDEAATVYLSHYVPTPGLLFDLAHNMEAPLPAVMVWVWVSVYQLFYDPGLTSAANDFLLRLLPCLLSTLGIPMIYILTRRLVEDRRAAFTAAALFAVSPFQIYYAQELRSYAFTASAGLAAVYCCIRALEDGCKRAHLLLVLLMAALFYNHFTMVWFFLALNAYALMMVIRMPKRFLPWTLSQITVLILIAPGVLLAYRANQLWLTVTDQWVTFPRPTVKTVVLTFKDFFAGYSFSVWAYYALLVLGLVFLVAGFWRLRRRPTHVLLLALVIFLPILVNFGFWQLRTLSLYEHRIFILQGALILIPVSLGITLLPGRGSWAAALGLFVLLTLPALRDHYTHRLHPVQEHRIGVFDKVAFRAAARHLQEGWRQGDLLAHDSNFTIYPMKHYLPVPQHHLGMSPQDAALYIQYMGAEDLLRTHGLLPVPAEEATRGFQRVWLIEAAGITFDAEPQSVAAREWLRTRYKEGETCEAGGVKVTLFALPGTIPPPEE